MLSVAGGLAAPLPPGAAGATNGAGAAVGAGLSGELQALAPTHTKPIASEPLTRFMSFSGAPSSNPSPWSSIDVRLATPTRWRRRRASLDGERGGI